MRSKRLPSVEDISLSDVRKAKVWRLVDPNTRHQRRGSLAKIGPIEELPAKPYWDDFVIYSALAVREDGEVIPLLILKVLRPNESGDYLQYTGGHWQPIRKTTGPRITSEFVGNPHHEDQFFEGVERDEREWHRVGFSQHAPKIGTVPARRASHSSVRSRR